MVPYLYFKKLNSQAPDSPRRATSALAASLRGRSAILFDGNSTYGAYHGTPPLFNARGEPVHAVFSALRSLVSWLRKGRGDGGDAGGTRHPWSQYDLAAVCWDRQEPTFRSTLVPEYKAQRSPPRANLRPQFGLARDAVASLGVCQFDAVGFEAMTCWHSGHEIVSTRHVSDNRVDRQRLASASSRGGGH